VGIVSLIFWSLIVVISIKYAVLIMRADNHGEGGILALLALVSPARARTSRRHAYMVLVGLIGAALLYGDGAITPAISVLCRRDSRQRRRRGKSHYPTLTR